MVRYYDSRHSDFGVGLGPGWQFEYSWGIGSGDVSLPNGNVYNFSPCGPAPGVSEHWESLPNLYNPPTGSTAVFRLADGGTVKFTYDGARWAATSLIDPYGQTTRIDRVVINNYSLVSQVTEPGGRFLKFIYGPADPNTGIPLLSEVDSYAAAGQQIDSVTYTYSTKDPGNGIAVKVLTTVGYSDNTSASYSYQADNNLLDPAFPLLATADDVRYNGPMRHIAYQYWSGGNQTVRHGTVSSENNLNGAAVSSISRPNGPGGTLPCNYCDGWDPDQATPVTRTETRGDGYTRTFTYTPPPPNCSGQDCNICFPVLTSQFLKSYTDFQGHTTYLGYDGNRFINSVTDARGTGPGDPAYTTTYQRGPAVQNGGTGGGIGQILQVTHPDGSSIVYSYYSDPHYVHTITNERNEQTIYTRDSNNRITGIGYPDGGAEAFTNYNTFGQVTVHQRTNGAYESFVYDGRGLLTDEYNPKFNSIPGGSDPHTHYTYYSSGPWTDRVLTMTLPANMCSFVASETYEYDRDASGTPVAGRGLVTKITHADGNYQSFGYDIYGNKLWAENELLKRTTYALRCL